MTRLIPLTDFQKGMHTDDYRVPGTARWLFDFVPHRGILRRRGPAKADTTSSLSLSPGNNVEYRISVDFTTYDRPVQHAFLPGMGEICGASSSMAQQNTGGGTWTVLASGDYVSYMARVEGASTFSMLTSRKPSYWTGATDEWEPHVGWEAQRWIELPDGEALGILGTARNTDYPTVVRWGGAVSGVWSSTDHQNHRAVVTNNSQKVTFYNTATSSAMAAPPSYIVENSYMLVDADRVWHRVSHVDSDCVYLDTVINRATTAATGVQFQIRDVAPLSISSAHTNGVAKFRNIRVSPGVFKGRAEHANTPNCNAAAFHQGRLFFGGIVEGHYRSATQIGSLYKVRPTLIRWSGLSTDGGDKEGGIFKGINYFADDAYLELPGEGGQIKAMASFNDQLVVMRESALQVVTGGFATDGEDLGATVQTISTTVGCTNAQTWDVCEAGVVFADAKGCYLWDGRQVRDLVRDRISAYWLKKGGAKMLCVANNRLIVTFDGSMTNETYFENLSYLFGRDAWFGFYSAAPISRVAAVSSDTETYWRANAGTVTTATCENLAGHYDDKTGTSAGRDGDELDNGSGYYPLPELLTQPVPLVDGIQNGRVTDIILSDAGNVSLSNSATLSIMGYKGPAYQYGYGADYELGEECVVLDPVGPDWETRSHLMRALRSDEATHVQVLLRASPDGQPFDYRLIGLGLVVDDEGRFEV